LPLIKVGPILHYELSSGQPHAAAFRDASSYIGLRARLMLPYPAASSPTGTSNWLHRRETTAFHGDLGGHFLEIPIGIGLAYQMLELFRCPLTWRTVPLRPSAGSAFDFGVNQPNSGYSALIGVALDL